MRGAGGSTRSDNVPRPVPPAFVAVREIAKVPTCMGAPEIRPVAVSTVRPFGRPLAAKLVGSFVAVIWKTNELSLVAVAVEALVITGGDGLIVRVNVALPVPPLLVALMVTEKVPEFVGTPEITPLLGSRDRPSGSPLAPNEVGLLLALIW